MVSETQFSNAYNALREVLILVLVEDGLGAIRHKEEWEAPKFVLILVLVEDGLGVTHQHSYDAFQAWS